VSPESPEPQAATNATVAAAVTAPITRFSRDARIVMEGSFYIEIFLFSAVFASR
jgi:hypothetical protein